jgi:pre-mRNA-processing factor 17
MLAGFVEQTHINDFQFENQRRTFNSYGYALDPTVGETPEEATHFVDATEAAKEVDGKTGFESTKDRKSDKRQHS